MSVASQNGTTFSWVAIYAELAKTILQYRDRQPDLIKMLNDLQAQGIPVISTTDRDENGKKFPLVEIDPFTFFATFNRHATEENRRTILKHVKAKLGLQSAIPTGFDGIPIVIALASWFFTYKAERDPEDISSLWRLAEAVVNGSPENLDAKLYERCLKIRKVGRAKLTMGMFWLNPKQYIAWDANNRTLFEQYGINGDIKTQPEYLELLKEVRGKIGTNFVDISRKAWELQGGKGPHTKRYWAGGHRWGETSKLDEFLKGNSWQLGWGKTDSNPKAKKDWEYFEQVSIGDEFAIKGFGGRNDLVIHYIGEVVKKSADGILKLHKLNRDLYKGKGPPGLAGATWFDTLVPITSKAIVDVIFHSGEIVFEKPVAARNLILYGPPGTGKTYQTIELAVESVDPTFSSAHASDRVALKGRFDELVLQGRIDFITFHQSYSYEDFVEGIRPVLDPSEELASPRYECRAGAFKRLALNSLFDCLEEAERTKGLVPFDILWKTLIAKIESEPEARYPGLSEKTSYEFTLTERGNIEGTNVLSNKAFLCPRKLLQQVFESKRSQESVTSTDVMEVLARGSHSQLIAAVFNELRRIEKSQFHHAQLPKQKIVHTESDKLDIVQRFLTEGARSGYNLKEISAWKRYVLVIDEINRGNISKILGELITLLEPDKRFGADSNRNSLLVTLPYSGEKFVVPANLDVIATMNTADKSIALVDVALRRRFEFEEVRVDLSLCDGLTTEMRNALQELNLRIALRKDRDHQVGHAYFINVTDELAFNRCFRRQIIPLLQEYFYNDWEGLRYVLGDNASPGHGADGGFIRKAGGDAKEARTKWQWFFDAGVDDLNCFQTLLANYQIG